MLGFSGSLGGVWKLWLEGIQHVEAIENQSSCQDAFASSLKQFLGVPTFSTTTDLYVSNGTSSAIFNLHPCSQVLQAMMHGFMKVSNSLDVFHPATSRGGFRSCNWMTAVFASHMKSKAFLPSAAQLGEMYIAWL